MHTVKCSQRDFECVEFVLSYSNNEDKKLLDNLILSSKELATKVNPYLARDASRIRDFNTVWINAFAGLVSEWCWRYWLKQQVKKKSLNLKIEPGKFSTATNQIDIVVHYPNCITKYIEVRSSFPYTGLENAICRAFNIIGWYVNPIKHMEIRKDYYVMALFPFKSSKIWERLKNGQFACYLVGGATRKLLEENEYAEDKELTPYYEICYGVYAKKTIYRVIPIVKAYDIIEITERILNGADV